MLDLKKKILTQKKGLYAVSAAIRGNHNIQSEFVKLGGLKAVLRVIKHSTSNPIKVKAVTLLYDLIVEQNEIMQKLIDSGKKKPNEKYVNILSVPTTTLFFCLSSHYVRGLMLALCDGDLSRSLY